MATIQTHVAKDGKESYKVVWREPGAKKIRSRRFPDKDKAITLKDFLDANGNSYAAATEVKTRMDNRLPTVSEVVDRHISLLTKPQPGTIQRYKNLAKAHIHGSPLGHMPAEKATKRDVIEWMASLRATKGSNIEEGSELSQRTKKNVHALLSTAFNTAVENDDVERNPAKGVGDPDLHKSREPVYLSEDDLEIIEEAMPERYQLFIRFLGKTGLRYSEATALRKRDIRVSGERCTVMVTRAWKNTGAGEEIGLPKTKQGERQVNCGPKLSASLIEVMKDMRPGEFVFTRPNGEFLRNSYFHKNVWQPVISKLVEDGDLDDKPWIHEIRKAHTTHLLQKGVPVKDVQTRLGHQDPQTTLRIYAQVTTESDVRAADLVD
ncbi:tyrosine-type recombinase/integrase [Glutamicibacter sp.]|uniref:tyrosine-type recombinase/integrase n=1 Tax=Glutamicibacter sp. TaxID=1931995 RepID=UPI002B4925D7|nr:site-specific integrase [Glutamicibacter sp.]HJX77257.1 site-specific integrase [Glutamicibacter sp.]